MSRVNTSCHMWMRHVAYTWVMSHVNESMSRVNETCHVWISTPTRRKARLLFTLRHMWMRHVTCGCLCWSRVKESCHMCRWVISHVNETCNRWMSRVTYKWVMSHVYESFHVWMSQVAWEWVMSHVNESCHMWMGHATPRSPTSLYVTSHMNHITSDMNPVTRRYIMSHMN